MTADTPGTFTERALFISHGSSDSVQDSLSVLIVLKQRSDQVFSLISHNANTLELA